MSIVKKRQNGLTLSSFALVIIAAMNIAVIVTAAVGTQDQFLVIFWTSTSLVSVAFGAAGLCIANAASDVDFKKIIREDVQRAIDNGEAEKLIANINEEALERALAKIHNAKP